ncbi:DUF3368 domain-containing protein [Balneolaceae bacterium ANBcel3]|nr:DUF3368 domain-containing protein [Balneolaceae bacterium ANBcel3]
MPKSIVCDASCLILFNKIGSINLLYQVFGSIIITDTVAKEFGHPIPEWIQVRPANSILLKGLLNILDAGEASAITLATELDDALLIIDEYKGRKVARKMGLTVTGSLGVIVIAKKKGHISSVKEFIEKIERTNFRISPSIIQYVLNEVGES